MKKDNKESTAFAIFLYAMDIVMIAIVVGVITILTMLCSCKKYDQQSGVTFSTVKHRLEGNWTVSSVTIINAGTSTPIPASYPSYTESFTNDGSNKWSYTSNHTTGTVKCSMNKKSGIIVFTIAYGNSIGPGQNVVNYTIHKLTNSEMWYTAKGSSGNSYECKLNKQ